MSSSLDKAQLIAQIRFALEQLSQRNAQHEWEHLCRHFARERICSNILPATGPVQAGGDQGRDFETFQTFLARGPLKNRSFVGLVSNEPIAFACTLDKSLPSKIKSDVKSIVSSGTKVKAIYFFASRDLEVPKRHEIQRWAKDQHSVDLEILDGNAISEHLSDPDLFWLAVRYLQLPSQLLPAFSPPDDEADWYTQTLNKWRNREEPPQTFADYTEILAATEFARGPFAYDDDGQPLTQYERSEFPFWIEKLQELTRYTPFETLRRRAFYQASVNRLRGLGTLRGQEEALQHFFADISTLKDVSELEDVEALIIYIHGAISRGAVDLERSEATSWLAALETQLEAQIREAKKHHRLDERCILLEIRGHLALASRVHKGAICIDEAMQYWTLLAKLAKEAPFFPVRRFARRLTEYATLIGTHPEYDLLIQSVDSLLAERVGHFQVAENCLERAKIFAKAGELSRSIAQLHLAKIDWLAEETLGKSLVAIRWLSRAYAQQGLYFAAKYYALAGAFLAMRARNMRLRSHVARFLEMAAFHDYARGAWHGFLDIAEACSVFYPHFANDPVADFNNIDGILNRLLYHLGVQVFLAQRFYPQLEPYVRERCRQMAERFGLTEVMEEIPAEAAKEWALLDEDTFWEAIQKQIAGSPWSDAGAVHRATWKAHGIAWSAEWDNEYFASLIAEEFLAALQILLSDLAGHDLCLMRTAIKFRITMQDEQDRLKDDQDYKGFSVQFDASNADRIATIGVPGYERFRNLTTEDVFVGVLSVASGLLEEVSLLPHKDYHSILGSRFKQGLTHKLGIGANFETCLRNFITKDAFDSSARSILVTARPFSSRVYDGLPWFNGPGPGYTIERSHQVIRNRYQRFAFPIGRTLKYLNAQTEFQMTVRRLRESGWKDWHILSAVYHVTMNFRCNLELGIRLLRGGERAYWERVSSLPEPESAPLVPVSEYSEENLRWQFQVYLVSSTETWGLEIHQLTPDFVAIDDFLTHRYNFWIDDVEHDDPFLPRDKK